MSWHALMLCCPLRLTRISSQPTNQVEVHCTDISLGFLLHLFNFLFFQDIVSFVQQQAAIVEEQSKTIKEQSFMLEDQSMKNDQLSVTVGLVEELLNTIKQESMKNEKLSDTVGKQSVLIKVSVLHHSHIA